MKAQQIEIKNAHQNNLQHIDLQIPHKQFVVVTGLSGSGKSSLAFETLFEEGRRRYVESLSSYVRQFLGKIKKPKADYIRGLPPAIAIEQKKSSSNSRSTVGTVTEIYHYLKMLYARAGTTYSPVTGEIVGRDSVDDIVDFILNQQKGTKILILSKLHLKENRGWHEELNILLQQGFIRLYISGELVKVEDFLTQLENAENEEKLRQQLKEEAYLLVDRIVLKKDDDDQISRIADSVQTAVYEGHGYCEILCNDTLHSFSNTFERDGIVFEEPTPDLFSFNSPYGACPECGGFGEHLGIDENKVIPNKYLSVYDGAVVCWESEKMKEWKHDFLLHAKKYNFPVFTPYHELTIEQQDLLWEGAPGLNGIDAFFAFLESNSYKIHYRILQSRFKGRTTCKKCRGTRLRKEANFVKIDGKSLGELVMMPIGELHQFFKDYSAKEGENKVASRLLYELNHRLQMLIDVGLSYLTLNRTSRSLSGGELQRIQLIYSIGSNLTGSLYILDEPSIGLHPRDTSQLIKILKSLKDIGNTVLVVEHDEDIIRSADQIIDLGPMAGRHGGKVVFQGNFNEANGKSESLTVQYLNHHLKIPLPRQRRKIQSSIEIKGAQKHNLKNIDVSIPLHSICVITGVSGSGKSSLVRDVIYESLKNVPDGMPVNPVNCASITGDLKEFSNIEFISQDSIDRSRRSNAATYLKVFDHIRDIFASLPQSKMNGYSPSYFSFNVEGGRCETCKGDGKIIIEMQFVADMHLICEDCKGKRYKDEILDVRYKGKNIDEVLSMTIDEAIAFFSDQQAIVNGLKPLQQVGLDYLQLGQATSTLSGGEAQRLKLASYLAKSSSYKNPTLFIFDEPTTGLHFHDINKLLDAFNALIEKGHSLLVIEHNLEVIKSADYVIDLGPGGGHFGGDVVCSGTPEEIAKCSGSETGKYLKSKV